MVVFARQRAKSRADPPARRPGPVPRSCLADGSRFEVDAQLIDRLRKRVIGNSGLGLPFAGKGLHMDSVPLHTDNFHRIVLLYRKTIADRVVLMAVDLDDAASLLDIMDRPD